MKKAVLPCLLVLAAAFHARADLVLVEKKESSGEALEIITKYKTGKLRVETGNIFTEIFDFKAGEETTLLHGNKMMMKFSSAGKMAELHKDAPDADLPKPVDTGKVETIKGHESRIYTMELGDGKLTVWVARDFPNFAALNEQLKKIYALQQSRKFVIDPDLSVLDGIPVKTVFEKDGKAVVTITFVSITEEAVADAEFQIPPGYKDIFAEMNGMGAPPATPAPPETKQAAPAANTTR